jgi:hypothetical protein
MTSNDLTRLPWNGTERKGSEKLRHAYEMKTHHLRSDPDVLDIEKRPMGAFFGKGPASRAHHR